MYSYEYVRIEGEDSEQLMEVINIQGRNGFRLCRWYENPEKKIFVGIMERSRNDR